MRKILLAFLFLSLVLLPFQCLLLQNRNTLIFKYSCLILCVFILSSSQDSPTFVLCGCCAKHRISLSLNTESETRKSPHRAAGPRIELRFIRHLLAVTWATHNENEIAAKSVGTNGNPIHLTQDCPLCAKMYQIASVWWRNGIAP